VLEEFIEDAAERMEKSQLALRAAFSRIRTGRANPAILDGVEVDYYGTATPIKQVATITVEEARSLLISPWEKRLVPDIEKAILKSDLGLTPSSTGDVVRLPMPPLTEENRRDLIRLARQEAENARVAIRNIRRDVIADVRELVREKEATEDDGRRSEDDIQKVTDEHVLFPIFPLTGSLERAMRGEPAFAWEPEKGTHVGVMRRDGSLGMSGSARGEDAWSESARSPPRAIALSRTRLSSRVFHSPQSGHRPIHFICELPHSLQMNRVLTLVATNTNLLPD